MPVTEVAYVCTPDFWRYLFLSMRSLFASGSSFDRLVIYLVSDRQPDWKFRDSRIHVRLVKDISSRGPWGNYWGTNKTHFCDSDADRLIYLDTDTIVLRPLEESYADKNEELIARLGVENFMSFWKQEVWKGWLEAAGVPDYPFVSPGFMVFQHQSQQRVRDFWREIIERILENKMPVKPSKHTEMWAFSMAASHSRLPLALMEQSHHSYAMIGEPYAGSIVCHLGTPGFFRHFFNMERNGLISNGKGLPIPKPKMLRPHALRLRIRHRLDLIMNGSREKRLQY